MKKNNRNNIILQIAFTLGVIVIITYSFNINKPHRIAEECQPDTKFSAARAKVHLVEIASRKNPIGSEANKNVRKYISNTIQQIGFKPEVQYAQVYDSKFRRAANIENVLTRIDGTSPTGTVLFMGHYDTVEDSFGASDNGAAVACLLELLRLLMHYPKPQNNFVFLFTDGEEIGLMGAKAFIDQHPWAKDVSLIINLEARGTRGQSIMFETGWNNSKAIKLFNRAISYPVASSLTHEIYKRLPNDTDFTRFKNKGLQGFNFVYIEKGFNYHTENDNLENICLRSVQHHGTNITDLALYLAINDLDFESRQDAVYFNTLGNGFIWYPYSWVLPLTFIVLIVFIAIIFVGLKRKYLSPLAILKGVCLFVFQIVFIFLLAYGLFSLISNPFTNNHTQQWEFNLTYQWVVNPFYPSSGIRLLEYNVGNILIGFTGISLAISLFIITFQKVIATWDFTIGAASVWALLMLIVCLIYPGASYLLIWPLLFSLIPLAIIFNSNKIKQSLTYSGALYLVFALPLLIWFPWLIYMLVVAMGVKVLPFATILLTLAIGLLIPLIDKILIKPKWIIPIVFLIFGLFFIAKSTIGVDFNTRYKKQNNIIYASNNNTGQSFWLTLDGKPDEWTMQFITKTPDTITLTDFFPSTENTYLAQISDSLLLPGPIATVISDTLVKDKRVLTLNIKSQREAERLTVYFSNGSNDISFRINNSDNYKSKSLRNTIWHAVGFFAIPNDGFMFTLYGNPNVPFDLRITDHKLGIPDNFLYCPRPEYIMPFANQSIAMMKYQF